jgi:hypothetical protein
MKRSNDKSNDPVAKKTRVFSNSQVSVQHVKTALEYAREWHTLGKIVVPLVSNGNDEKTNGKSPCIKQWNKTTIEQSTQYLNDPKYEKHNWGLITGSKNGVWVLDLDIEKEQSKSGVEWMEKWFQSHPDSKQPSYRVQTGSGGYHYYYLYDEKMAFHKNFAGITENSIKYGVDCRSDGGLIVLPGSVHSKTGNSYQLLNDKIQLDLIDQPLFDHLQKLKTTVRPQSTIVTSIPNERSQNSTIVPISSKLPGDEAKKIARIFKRLDVKRADSYDDWVKALIFLKSCGEEFKEVARDFSKKSSKYKEEEFEHKWSVVLQDPTSTTPSKENQLTLGTFILWSKQDHSFLDLGLFSSKDGCSLYKFTTKFNNQVICEDNMEEAIQMLQKCVSRIFASCEYIVRTTKDEVQTMDFPKFKQMMDTYTIKWKENEQNTTSLSMYEWIHDRMDMYITVRLELK